MFIKGFDNFSQFKEKLIEVSNNKTLLMVIYTIVAFLLLYFLHCMITNGLYTVKEGYTNNGLETLPDAIKNFNNVIKVEPEEHNLKAAIHGRFSE